MRTERVAVVDDHAMVLDGLVAMLALDERIEVVGSARTVEEGKRRLPGWEPSVLVVDDQLPDGRGTDLARHARAAIPECAVLMISGADRPGAIDDAIEAGCSGFVSKGLGTEELADAVTAVARGSSIFPAAALRRLWHGETGARPATVTEREVEVLAMLADMHTPCEISAELGISLHTVRNHIRSILSKLQARTQLEAVIIGLRLGLIELERDQPGQRSA